MRGETSKMMETVLSRRPASEPVPSGTHDAWTYEVQTRSGDRQVYGSGEPSFVVHVPDRPYWATLVQANAYSAGMAFVRGDFQIDGDILQAIRWWCTRRAATHRHEWVMRAINRLRLESWFQTAARARHNIRFHYDRSNLFYRQFLDRRMVYSCAYFADQTRSLDDAQLAKLDHICRKLDLAPGERFLDVGCGWGALVIRAAQQYGVTAVGCTLSAEQHSYATEAMAAAGLGERATIFERDYRELKGSFEKIASVGMFEHVGRRRLREYFARVSELLTPDGLFLNHGIVRPSSIRADSGTTFLQHRVFPGAELASLGDVVREAERAGFEVLDVENLRPHYAITSAAWVARLQEHRNACLSLVEAETYRTWLLYLAGASISFEQSQIEVHQILLAKRLLANARRLTRSYMYGGVTPRVRFTPDGSQSSFGK